MSKLLRVYESAMAPFWCI